MTEVAQVQLDGVPVDIGGKVFIVPPLTLGAFKRTKKAREALGDPATSADDRAEAAVAVIHASLKRNYPDLAIEEIEELVTFSNMVTILPQVVAAWSAEGNSSGGKATAGTP